MMTKKKLAELADLAVTESPFTKLSLDNLGNEALIRKRLQVEMEKHFRAKEGAEGLVGRLKKVMGENLTRAKTIAQTERTRALNGMRVSEAIKQYLQDYDKAVKGHRKRPPVPEFRWINPLRAREPRHMHVAISGSKRPVGEEFLPGLRYPGDPGAPASQTVNCHCYVRRVG